MTFEDWLDFGMKRGWCSDIVCATHDGLPNTVDEEFRLEEGDDPCVPALRLWEAKVAVS